MAFGFAAAKVAVEFCMRYSKRICDPFCGQGTALHVAESFGVDSVGVVDPRYAKSLRPLLLYKSWAVHHLGFCRRLSQCL
jgi:hypothetical protein